MTGFVVVSAGTEVAGSVIVSAGAEVASSVFFINWRRSHWFCVYTR